MVYHDFANFPESLFNFSISRITNRDIIEFKADENLFLLSDNYKDKFRELLKNSKDEIYLFWLEFSVGFECLLKAIFMINNVGVLKKKELYSKEIKNDKIKSIYRNSRIAKLKSLRNDWFDGNSLDLNDMYLYEISSLTFGVLKNKIDELEFDTEKSDYLKEVISCVADLRRNVDAHIYLKTQVGMFGNEIEVYVEALNEFVSKKERF